MPETHINGSAAVEAIVFNGVDLDKMYFNNVLVFEKIRTASETLAFASYYTPGSQTSSAGLNYVKNTITLSHTPKKVTAISGGLGYSSWAITSALSGTTSQPTDAAAASSGKGNFTTLTWSISGNVFTLSGNGSGAGTKETHYISITYDY